MPLAQKEEEQPAAELARAKLQALTPVKVTKQAEEGYGQAQKNAQLAMEKALSMFSRAEDRGFHEFLRDSQIKDIIMGGRKSFENSKVEFAYTGQEEKRKQIYSIRVQMNGEPPKTLTLTTSNDSVQMLLTDQYNNPTEHMMQKGSALKYQTFA